MRATATVMVITVLFAVHGCQSESATRLTEGSVTVGDLVTTATIERLDKPGQFNTRVTVQVSNTQGELDTIASTNITSVAGKEASVDVGTTSDKVSVAVHIPEPEHQADGVDIRVTIERGGVLAASPSLRLRVHG